MNDKEVKAYWVDSHGNEIEFDLMQIVESKEHVVEKTDTEQLSSKEVLNRIRRGDESVN